EVLFLPFFLAGDVRADDDRSIILAITASLAPSPRGLFMGGFDETHALHVQPYVAHLDGRHQGLVPPPPHGAPGHTDIIVSPPPPRRHHFTSPEDGPERQV
ncbi:unnamed protein product, partial [Urochloa humidicola]